MQKNCLLNSVIERLQNANSFNSTGKIIQEDLISDFLFKKSYFFVVSFVKGEIFKFELEEIGGSFGRRKLEIRGENGQFRLRADAPRMSHEQLSLTNQYHQAILGAECLDMFRLVWNNFFVKNPNDCYLSRLEQVELEVSDDRAFSGTIRNPLPSKLTLRIDENSCDLIDIEISSNISVLNASQALIDAVGEPNILSHMNTQTEVLGHLAPSSAQQILKKTFYQFMNVKVA